MDDVKVCAFSHGCSFNKRGRILKRTQCERRRQMVTNAKIVKMNDGPPKRERRQNDNDANDSESDTELSRRVFLAGTVASTVFTAAASYRFFVGEDLETRVRTEIARRFPQLFRPDDSKGRRRQPLDASFAAAYFDALEKEALNMGFSSSAGQLHSAEAEVKQLAESLFFYGDDNENVEKSTASFDNADWLNFALYARLHVIAANTSPRSRLSFSEAVARRTLPLLQKEANKNAERRCNGAVWLGSVIGILQALVAVGWISSFRVEPFDGVAWEEDKRATLTVYASDAVTMQAAQLIGEEAFEEMSPKVSPWIRLVLMDCGIRVSAEDYYLDDVYRPDPTFYKPTIIATQFDLFA